MAKFISRLKKRSSFCQAISCLISFLRSPEAAFNIEWHGRRIRIKASNGKYVSVLASGHMAVADEPEDFILRLTNRYVYRKICLIGLFLAV